MSFLFLLNFIYPKLALGWRSERPMSNDRILVDAIPLKDRLFFFSKMLASADYIGSIVKRIKLKSHNSSEDKKYFFSCRAEASMSV